MNHNAVDPNAMDTLWLTDQETLVFTSVVSDKKLLKVTVTSNKNFSQ
jgi:hypothetical protein